MLSAAFSLAATLFPQICAHALRSAPGQLFASVNYNLGYRFHGPSVSGGVYTPTGRVRTTLGHHFLKADSSIEGISVPFQSYDLSLSYDLRLFSTPSRSFILGLGAGPYASILTRDPLGKLPERISLQGKSTLFPFGAVISFYGSLYLLESFSLEGGVYAKCDLSGKDAIPLGKSLYISLKYDF